MFLCIAHARAMYTNRYMNLNNNKLSNMLWLLGRLDVRRCGVVGAFVDAMARVVANVSLKTRRGPSVWSRPRQLQNNKQKRTRERKREIRSRIVVFLFVEQKTVSKTTGRQSTTHKPIKEGGKKRDARHSGRRTKIVWPEGYGKGGKHKATGDYVVNISQGGKLFKVKWLLSKAK